MDARTGSDDVIEADERARLVIPAASQHHLVEIGAATLAQVAAAASGCGPAGLWPALLGPGLVPGPLLPTDDEWLADASFGWAVEPTAAPLDVLICTGAGERRTREVRLEATRGGAPVAQARLRFATLDPPRSVPDVVPVHGERRRVFDEAEVFAFGAATGWPSVPATGAWATGRPQAVVPLAMLAVEVARRANTSAVRVEYRQPLLAGAVLRLAHAVVNCRTAVVVCGVGDSHWRAAVTVRDARTTSG